MIYHRSDGSSFLLVHHTPEEWAEIRRAQVLALGCSQEYANKIAASYQVTSS